MSEIYLIRHGQATFDKNNYDHLSPKGFAQADILAKHLELTGTRFDAFYHGENLRHKQTMEPSLNLLKDREKVTLRPAFTEFEFGDVMREVIPFIIEKEPGFKKDVDGMFDSNPNFQKVFEKTVYTWLDGQDNFKSTPWREFVKRVKIELDEVMKNEGAGKKIAIFTSGGVISAVVQIALSISERDALKLSWQILNASVTRLKYNNDEMGLCSMNEAAFLAVEPGMITYR